MFTLTACEPDIFKLIFTHSQITDLPLHSACEKLGKQIENVGNWEMYLKARLLQCQVITQTSFVKDLDILNLALFKIKLNPIELRHAVYLLLCATVRLGHSSMRIR